MTSKMASGRSSGRYCVYTVLIGGYEHLNEQPVAAGSDIRFVCFTDDPDLKSDTWDIRHVSPCFALDPIRSQRVIKLRPHVHLSEYEASLYIDNNVTLKEIPEKIFDKYLPGTPFSLPSHSFRRSVFDEFVEVVRLGRDDPARVVEQLNHYTLECPEILEERPYWGAILLRDHRSETVQVMLETWLAHVLRYSRRDQLSANVAFVRAKLRPQVMEIDNSHSWFHTWPHVRGRQLNAGMRQPGVGLRPPLFRLRELELNLADQAAQQAADRARALADQRDQYEEAMSKLRRKGVADAGEQRRWHDAAMAEQRRLYEQVIAQQRVDQAETLKQALAGQERSFNRLIAEHDQMWAARNQQLYELQQSRGWSSFLRRMCGGGATSRARTP